MSQKFKVKSRLWISSEEGTFLGDGKVRLLQAVERTGSITAAAKELEISYRKAWKLIDVMNAQAEKPLVVRQSGGSNGGGTIVTDAGKHAVQTFIEFKSKCENYINQEFTKLHFD